MPIVVTVKGLLRQAKVSNIHTQVIPQPVKVIPALGECVWGKKFGSLDIACQRQWKY